MAEYSRFARGSYTSDGTAQVINLPFRPDRIELMNYTAAATPTQDGVPYAFWQEGMPQNSAVLSVFDATPALITDVITSDGFSTFSAGQALQFGASQQVVSITKASPAVVTVTAHGYSTGDVVVFQGLYQSPTTGMPQIVNIPFRITVTGANTFTIPWNTNQSNYTALSGSPTGAMVKKVLYPFLYAPGVSYITSMTLGTTTTVNFTAPHNLRAGSEVAFRIPSAWGTSELNSLPNSLIPGSPVYGVVVTVTDDDTVVVNIDSSTYTAFNTNQPATNISGLTPPLLVAIGDLNTGGWPVYAGSQLYPPPQVAGAETINGPAIQGAFVNNTRSGFIIGAAASAPILAGASSDVVYWRAMLHDMSV